MSRAPELIGWFVPSPDWCNERGCVYIDRTQAEYHAGFSASIAVEPVYLLPSELAGVHEPSARQVVAWMLWGAVLTISAAGLAYAAVLVLS